MNAEKIKTAICIIGAGPSGATASIFLGKMGISHVIVDAAEFPRDKICGDGLDLNAVRVLNHIDPEIVQKEIIPDKKNYTASSGLRFILPSGKQVDITNKANGKNNSSNKRPVFFVSKRMNFDNFLINKIDRSIADARFATRIEKITKDGNIWKLEGSGPSGKIEIETGFLVGADGDHSIVLNYLGERRIDRNYYAGAVRQYWKGVTGLHQENLLEVYFPKSLPYSYFWIFPLPGAEANVGFGMASNHIAKKNINVRKAFEDLIITDPVIAQRFKNARPLEKVKGWGIPLSGGGRKAHGDGWLLLGDAASIVCPSSGEGVGSGMISGYVAAKFIQKATHHIDFSEKMFTNYDREIRKRLVSEEKYFRFLINLPGWAFSKGISAVISNRFFKNWLATKGMPSWEETAYSKEIEVKIM